MRTVPPRSPWLQLITLLGLLVGGPFLGLQLGVRLTPSSDVVQVVSTFAFAITFVGGMALWMGFGIVAVVASALWKLLRGRNPWADSPHPSRCFVPPGSRVFLILGVLMGGATGCLAGLLGDLGFLASLAIWTGAGAAYGGALWSAAFNGYLPFPEPE